MILWLYMHLKTHSKGKLLLCEECSGQWLDSQTNIGRKNSVHARGESKARAPDERGHGRVLQFDMQRAQVPWISLCMICKNTPKFHRQLFRRDIWGWGGGST